MLGRAMLVLAISACALRDPPQAVTPAAPLPADPPIALESMQVECDGLLAALASYKECKHLEPGDAAEIEAWIEAANRNLAAGRKGNPEPNAQKAIAGACHRATSSVQAANQRCIAGPRPKT